MVFFVLNALASNGAEGRSTGNMSSQKTNKHLFLLDARATDVAGADADALMMQH
jgi:hypothetical protein